VAALPNPSPHDLEIAFKLPESNLIVSGYTTFRSGDREFNYPSRTLDVGEMFRTHFLIDWNPRILDELEQGVKTVYSHPTDVIGGISGVETTRTINSLRGIAGRLTTGDHSGGINAKMRGGGIGSAEGNLVEVGHGIVISGKDGVIAVSSDVYTQEPVFVTVLLPSGTQVREIRKGALDGTYPRGGLYLLGERFHGVFGSHDRCRKIAELTTTTLSGPRVRGFLESEEDFAARVGTAITDALRTLREGESVEPTLARTGILEGLPLLVKGGTIRFVSPKSGEIRHVPALREISTTPVLGVADIVVVWIRETDEGSTTHSARLDYHPYHACDVTHLKGGEFPARSRVYYRLAEF
jgi:hypothetical protein